MLSFCATSFHLSIKFCILCFCYWNIIIMISSYITTWLLFYCLHLSFARVYHSIRYDWMNLWRSSTGFSRFRENYFQKWRADSRWSWHALAHIVSLVRPYNAQSAGARHLARRVLCTNKLNAFHRRPPPLNASSPLDGAICRAYALMRTPLRGARGRILRSTRILLIRISRGPQV